MVASSWPSLDELDAVRNKVAEMSGADGRDVRVVVSPYRICPLGAHIDHQGGTVTAMTINMGILLGFVPSPDAQFNTSKKFLKNQIGYVTPEGITGFICGSEEHSSGLSSSAAVGIAYLLALETANCKIIAPEENIELDRLIENEYLHLKNGILDQSAILLSKYGYLTWMDCKTRKYDVANFSELQKCQQSEGQATYKILLAFSGLKEPLMRNSGYNTRSILKPNLAKRALHYFSENKRVKEGLEAWASGNLDEFGKLISASGRSSIENYECGCKEMIDLYEILLKAPGVFGARFSGAGFRGCCLALVDADLTDKAAAFVKQEYQKVQPELASKLPQDRLVLICEPGDSAHVV
ncbi:GHMP kinases C terminal [Musa troglodytarum]|uniref:GHMP kinases C terminal n=1 Tax=Musa troglodytarum TaxID=320322 RepID=A0A9E7GWH7_9LILI|nr:GHMP kinases C terminal [Musa troglodytarum]